MEANENTNKQNAAGYFAQVHAILKMAYENDDLMIQDTLFRLQAEVAMLARRVAIQEGKVVDLLNEFPFLYK